MSIILTTMILNLRYIIPLTLCLILDWTLTWVLIESFSTSAWRAASSNSLYTSSSSSNIWSSFASTLTNWNCVLKACSIEYFGVLFNPCSWEISDAWSSSTENCERSFVSYMATTIGSNIDGKLLKIFSTIRLSSSVSPWHPIWATIPITCVKNEYIVSKSFIHIVSKSLLNIYSFVVFTFSIPWYFV